MCSDGKKYKRDWRGNKEEQTNVLLEIKKSRNCKGNR
jgi:hypothetical protein